MVDGKLIFDANLAAATDITDFIKKNDIYNTVISNETKQVDADKNN